MALSKNEQIAVYIVIFVVIAAVGFFVFLLPEYEKISPNRAALADKQKELEDLSSELSIEIFEEVEADIRKSYEDGKHASEVFYETEFLNYEADRLIRGILKQMNIDIDNLSISELITKSLMLSIYRPTDIIYNIKEVAKIGTALVPEPDAEGEAAPDEGEEGEDAPPPPPPPEAEIDTTHMSEMAKLLIGASRQFAMEWYEEKMTKIRNGELEAEDGDITALDVIDAMREYLANETETVLVQNVRFEIPFTLAQATAFSMHIYELDRATYIVNMKPKDDNTAEGSEGSTGGESLDVQVQGFDEGKRLYEVEVMFLIVEPMEQPNFEYKTKFSWDN